VTDDYTLTKPPSPYYDYVDDNWNLNIDKAFNGDISKLNSDYDYNMKSLASEYNIAIARDGSVESEIVDAIRSEISDLDSQYEADQLAIITKYFGE
jgi:hypothetical protein